jgi:hypothetical protein
MGPQPRTRTDRRQPVGPPNRQHPARTTPIGPPRKRWPYRRLQPLLWKDRSSVTTPISPPSGPAVSPAQRSSGRHRARPRRPYLAGVTVVLFVATVVAANAFTAAYGLIPVGLGLTATAGTAAAGLSLLTRDWVHHAAGRTVVLVCIGAGAAVSAVLAGPRLAIASAAAFGLSELADLLVYQRLRPRLDRRRRRVKRRRRPSRHRAVPRGCRLSDLGGGPRPAVGQGRRHARPRHRRRGQPCATTPPPPAPGYVTRWRRGCSA